MDRCDVCASLLRKGECRRCAGQIDRPDLLGPGRRGPTGEFLVGFDLAIRGALLTLRRPRLLSLLILPLFLNLAVFAGLVYLVLDNRELLRPDFAEEWIFGLDWLRGLMQDAAVFLAVLVGVVLALAGTLLTSSVIAAPFLEWLSEAVESVVFGQGDKTPITPHYIWHMWIVPVFQAAGVAVLQAILAVLFLLLSLTGALAPLVFVGGVWLTAITLCDIAVARKRYPVSARFSLVNRSLSLNLGLALPFAFLPFLLPLGVAGSTLAFLRDRRLRTGG